MKLVKTSFYSVLLTLLLLSDSFADCSYELFSISSTKNTKIADFIDQLSDECEFSVIVSDGYTESILKKKLNKTYLRNLTIDEVLDIILKENNLSYTLENNILKISYLITKTFNIDYILSQRKGSGTTDITLSSSNNQQNMSGNQSYGSSGGSSNRSSSRNSNQNVGKNSTTESGIKIESNDEVKFWEELDLELQNVLNRAHDTYKAELPIINKNAGMITVTATSKQIQRLEEYLKKLQNKVHLQVLIDVQLLTVTMSEAKSTGVDWQQLYALQNITLEINNASGTKTLDDGTTYDLHNYVTIKAGGTLNQVIKFLQTQGDVNAISNPKVLTLNNQPALITVGTEYFYKIQTSTNQQGTGGGIAATTQNDRIQSVFAGVLLDITPEISDNNHITLKINPSISETTEDMAKNSSIDRNMPPDLNRRQLSSVVTIQDGNRIILGGLINTRNSSSSNKVPLLGDIPGLSYFFKYEEQIKQVEELIIIIEPHIIRKNNNNFSLADLGYEGITNDLTKVDNLRNSNENNISEENVEDNGL